MNLSDRFHRPKAGLGGRVLPAVILAICLAGCSQPAEAPLPSIRPVRTVVVESHEVEDPAVVTGHVRARDEVNLAFRLPGKVIARTVEVGDEVSAGQVVARLDDRIERSVLEGAEAELMAAKATLEEAEASERRKSGLIKGDAISRYDYDQAVRQLKTSRALVDAVQAKLDAARGQLGYTELKSETSGIVTATGAKAGEVVQAGQSVLTIAQNGARDAVFDMPAWVIREGLAVNREIQVTLADQESATALGRVREIAPQADTVTRNYEVKVELVDPPSAMFLGATVVGRTRREPTSLIEIPSTALTMLGDKPAVWVVNATGRMRRASQRQLRLDGTHQEALDPRQPGPGQIARTQLRVRRADDQPRGLGHHDHAGA